jgi:energy-coupling factor transporter ATP-binding protein EcfA2
MSTFSARLSPQQWEPPTHGRLAPVFHDVDELASEFAAGVGPVRDLSTWQLTPTAETRAILDQLGDPAERLRRTCYRVGFLGPSQVGKSTTFNTVLGVEKEHRPVRGGCEESPDCIIVPPYRAIPGGPLSGRLRCESSEDRQDGRVAFVAVDIGNSEVQLLLDSLGGPLEMIDIPGLGSQTVENDRLLSMILPALGSDIVVLVAEPTASFELSRWFGKLHRAIGSASANRICVVFTKWDRLDQVPFSGAETGPVEVPHLFDLAWGNGLVEHWEALGYSGFEDTFDRTRVVVPGHPLRDWGTGRQSRMGVDGGTDVPPCLDRSAELKVACPQSLVDRAAHALQTAFEETRVNVWRSEIDELMVELSILEDQLLQGLDASKVNYTPQAATEALWRERLRGVDILLRGTGAGPNSESPLVADNVSYLVEAGALAEFLGHNGSGKSTGTRTLTAFLSASSGGERINLTRLQPVQSDTQRRLVSACRLTSGANLVPVGPCQWPEALPDRLCRSGVQWVLCEPSGSLPDEINYPIGVAEAAGFQFPEPMHDEFHTQRPVYDASSAGSHFVPLGNLPDQNAPMSVIGIWGDNPPSGATAYRNWFEVVSGQPYWGLDFRTGLLNTDGRTGTNAGVSIPDPERLTFWARGPSGGEPVRFEESMVSRDADTGGSTNHFPDSSPRTPACGAVAMLTTSWQRVAVDLSELDTCYVLDGFEWTAEVARNPAGAVFFLDDINYDLTPTGAQDREGEPQFVRSDPTGPDQALPEPAVDLDIILRDIAFSYDRALAVLSLVADCDPVILPDSLRRTGLIDDAFVYTAGHDSTYTDGRIHTNYAAGDHDSLVPGWIATGKPDTAPVAGFDDEVWQPPRFFEFLHLSVDTGNSAWAMVTLLGLYTRTGDTSYLAAARRIGDDIRSLRYDTGTYPGFFAWIDNAETVSPAQRLYASTEHNIDVYAAFTRMFELTGEPIWRDDADHARRFIESMWDPVRGVYLAGTKDLDTGNEGPGQPPLDVQVWPVLARPDAVIPHPPLAAALPPVVRVQRPLGSRQGTRFPVILGRAGRAHLFWAAFVPTGESRPAETASRTGTGSAILPVAVPFWADKGTCGDHLDRTRAAYLRILVYDCGGGTTDLQLHAAKLQPESVGRSQGTVAAPGVEERRIAGVAHCFEDLSGGVERPADQRAVWADPARGCREVVSGGDRRGPFRADRGWRHRLHPLTRGGQARSKRRGPPQSWPARKPCTRVRKTVSYLDRHGGGCVENVCVGSLAGRLISRSSRQVDRCAGPTARVGAARTRPPEEVHHD